MLIMDRTCRAGEVVNLIYLQIERKCHIMTYELESRMRKKLFDVALGSRKKVINTKHLIAPIKQPLNKMRAQKSCTT